MSRDEAVFHATRRVAESGGSWFAFSYFGHGKNWELTRSQKKAQNTGVGDYLEITQSEIHTHKTTTRVQVVP